MRNLKKILASFLNNSPLNLKKISPVFIMLLIVAVFFWKVFLLGQVAIPGDFIVGVYHPWLDYKWGFDVGVPVKNPIMADVVSFSFPMRSFVSDLLKEGRVPLWNPYILNGVPLLANFQSAAFSPTNIFYFLFEKLTAWNFQIITQHFLALLFTYILLRYWKVSKIGAILAGSIYAFSGFNLIWSQWNAHTLVAAFVPLLILLTDRFLLERKIIFGSLISLVVALQIFAGYPQLVFYTFLAMGVLWLFRFQKMKKKIFGTILLGVFVLLGVGLAASQILPGAELLENSQRTLEAHPFEWAFLPWSKVITFVAADYFGNHATGNYWGPQDYTSNTGFVGVVALTLALIAIINFRKNRKIVFGICLMVFSLLLSFPTPISVGLWKSGVFGFNAAAAHRALFLFTFSISLLAGFGVDLLKVSKRRFWALLPSFITIALFGIYAFYIKENVGVKNLILPVLVVVLTGLIFVFRRNLKAGLLIISLLELFYFGWKFTPFSPRHLVYPETPVITFLKNQELPVRTTGNHVIPINFRMAYGIEAVEGYDAVYPASAANFVQQVNGGGLFRRYAIVDNDTSPLLDIANTKYYIALKNDRKIKRFDEKRFKVAFEDKSVVIFESLSAKPRGFLVNGGGTVQYTKYSEMESVISVRASGDDFLFVSDTWYPGWKAFIDNKEVLITKTSEGFRQIGIPKGEHVVVMKYEPDSFSKGVKIGFVSLLILVFVVFLSVFKKRVRGYTLGIND